MHPDGAPLVLGRAAGDRRPGHRTSCTNEPRDRLAARAGRGGGAHGRRLLRRRPAHLRPAGRRVPHLAVRDARASRSGTAVVRRPPHARLLDRVPAAGRAGSADRRWSARSRPLAAPRSSSGSLHPPLRRARALGRALVRLRGGHAAVLLAAAVGARARRSRSPRVLALQHRNVRGSPRCSPCSPRCRAPSPARSWRWAPSPTRWPTARDRRAGALVAAAGLLPPLVLTAAFPEGGYHPFVFSSFFIVPLVALARSPFCTPERPHAADRVRALRARGASGSFLVPHAVRRQHRPARPARRRAARACAVLAACRRARARACAGVALAGRARSGGSGRRSCASTARSRTTRRSQASYYEPVLDFLDSAQRRPPSRVDDPAAALAVGVLLRRQGDADRARLAAAGRREAQPALLRGRRRSTAGALPATGSARTPSPCVALPDAPIGYGGEDEVELIAAARPRLPARGAAARSTGRVYEVTAPHPLVVTEGGADIRRPRLVDPKSVQLDVRRPGSAIVRVHFSPYWRLDGRAASSAPATGPA